MYHKRKLRNSLIFQLTISIVVFISVIELILLFFSIYSKEKDYVELNQFVIEKVERDYHLIIEDPIDKEYIDKKIKNFILNITLLTLLIIVFVTTGTIFIFNLIGIKHIKKLSI